MHGRAPEKIDTNYEYFKVYTLGILDAISFEFYQRNILTIFYWFLLVVCFAFFPESVQRHIKVLSPNTATARQFGITMDLCIGDFYFSVNLPKHVQIINLNLSGSSLPLY